MSDLLKLATNNLPARIPARTAKKSEKDEALEKSKHYPKSRARLNIVPDSEALARLIDRALTALSKGVYWDRGSIINIVL